MWKIYWDLKKIIKKTFTKNSKEILREIYKKSEEKKFKKFKENMSKFEVILLEKEKLRKV